MMHYDKPQVGGRERSLKHQREVGVSKPPRVWEGEYTPGKCMYTRDRKDRII